MASRDPVAKAAYDKARYPQVRDAKIASARKWYGAHLDEKRQYDVARQPLKNARRRASYSADPSLIKASNKRTGRAVRLRKYGLDTQTFDALLVAQDGRCACCRQSKRTRQWHIDHDHKTGKVRGIVCGLCNTGIGHLGDDLPSVEAGVAYLRRHHQLEVRTIDEHW